MKKFGYVFDEEGNESLLNTDCIARVSVQSVMGDDWYFDVTLTDGEKLTAVLTIADEEIGVNEDHKAINKFMDFLGCLDMVQQY